MRKWVVVLVLAACGGKSSSGPSTPVDNSKQPDPTVAAAPGAGGRPPCAQEIALQCASGVDGCLDGRTTMHVCVAAEEKPGPPCEQEIAKVCPDGQIDACTDGSATTHICVFK